MLYLFCGHKRKADIKHFLHEFGKLRGFDLHVREVDIERSNEDDLLQQGLWEELWAAIDQGEWDVVLLTPPCNTFSRARCNRNSPGPGQLRNFQHPWGFPWLTGDNWQLLQDHNFLILQCFKTIDKCYAVGADFLFEHPEDLGLTESGETPASVWQLEQMQALVTMRGATTFAVYQCQFGAQSPKPTRFMTSLQKAKSLPAQGLPTFDSKRHYLGPLPRSCTHKYHVKKLIGKEAGKWRTADSAAYPPPLCKWLAQLIVSRVGEARSELNGGRVTAMAGQATELSVAQGLADEPVSERMQVMETQKPLQGEAPTEKVEAVVVEEVADTGAPSKRKQQQLHRGQPRSLEWAGKQRAMVDGFGLCSPTLWHPSDRNAYMVDTAQAFCRRLYDILQTAVLEKFDDIRLEAIKLGLGRIGSSPFSDEELKALRGRWASLLPSRAMALCVPERQPFYLGLIGQTLELLSDPDFSIYMDGKDSFWNGVPVGFDEPLPRVPELYPKKEKVRPLDDSEYNNMATNYKSAREMADDLEKKFREEEQLGRMIPTTVGEMKSKFPHRTPLVAAMGALRKPNGDVRPLHDGTHYVQLNNAILFQDQLQYPGPEDAAGMVRTVKEEQESVYALSADIKAAHRLVKIREEDWPLLGCKVRSEDKTVWINTVGTFGISSASYWWSRLFSGVGRVVGYVLNQQDWHQLVYVDDLHLSCLGVRKFLNLWVAILMYELMGTPFAYGKFTGGLQVQFVGYLLDYKECFIGITKRRGDWLIQFIDELARSKGTIYLRRFNEFLGRLGFVARVLIWLKPFLAPLYAWSAAIDRSTVATAPRLVLLVLQFLKVQLTDCTYLHSCERPQTAGGEVFRTHAKCEVNRVVLGGHHLESGKWFSLEVLPHQAPYLFKSDGQSQWASTTAELLAVLIALHLFGYLEVGRRNNLPPLHVGAGTDNLANEHLLKKGLTTKWPLCLVFMQLTEALMRAHVHVSLDWRPRDENCLADALTNGDFSAVDPGSPIFCVWEQFDFSLLQRLWEEREIYLDKEALRATMHHRNLGEFEKSAW